MDQLSIIDFSAKKSIFQLFLEIYKDGVDWLYIWDL